MESKPLELEVQVDTVVELGELEELEASVELLVVPEATVDSKEHEVKLVDLEDTVEPKGEVLEQEPELEDSVDQALAMETRKEQNTKSNCQELLFFLQRKK